MTLQPRAFLVAVSLSLLTHFSYAAAPSTASGKHHKSTKTDRTISRIIKLRSFSTLHVDDRIHVEVIAGARTRSIRLLGPESEVNKVSVHYHNRGLKIGIKKHQMLKRRVVAVVQAGQLSEITHNGPGKLEIIDLHGPVKALNVNASGPTSIAGKRLVIHQINLDGTGPVTINGLHADNVDINAHGENRLTMRGKSDIRNIDVSGAGKVSFYWVNSPHLHVNAIGGAVVELAGRADLFEAIVRNSAKVDARYLRAKRVFVKTYDESLATLQVTDSQNTLASDHSNIYFYKTAKFHGDFMSNSGTVLNMNGMS